jgi:hypothetical protein
MANSLLGAAFAACQVLFCSPRRPRTTARDTAARPTRRAAASAGLRPSTTSSRLTRAATTTSRRVSIINTTSRPLRSITARCATSIARTPTTWDRRTWSDGGVLPSASEQEGRAVARTPGLAVKNSYTVVVPRDGAITFRDIIGKLEILRVTCDKCGRRGLRRCQVACRRRSGRRH